MEGLLQGGVRAGLCNVGERRGSDIQAGFAARPGVGGEEFFQRGLGDKAVPSVAGEHCLEPLYDLPKRMFPARNISLATSLAALTTAPERPPRRITS